MIDKQGWIEEANRNLVQLQKAEQEITTLRQQLAAAGEVTRSLERAVMSAHELLDSFEVPINPDPDIPKLDARLIWLGNQRAIENARCQRLDTKLAAAEARVKELKTCNQILETCNQLNATEMQRYQIQSAQLEVERDDLKAELERVYAHNHDLEDAIAMGEHTVEVLEARVKELERVQGLWEDATIYGVTLTNQREALKAAVKKIEAEHQAGCNVAASMMRDLEEKGEGLRRELATAQGRIEAKDAALLDASETVDAQADKALRHGWMEEYHSLTESARSYRAALANGTEEVPSPDAECECGHTREQHEDGTGCCWDGPDEADCRCKRFVEGGVILGEDVTELARSKRQTVVSGGIQQIDANGAEPPNCARCRRDDCWPDCARFYDQPDGGTGEVKGDG